MSWSFFIDESGQDRRDSPHEVLASVAVEDRKIWPLIRQLADAQVHHFGMPLWEAYGAEAKATSLLTSKTFRLASQLPAMEHAERTALARKLLSQKGQNPTRAQLTALDQAKIAYCRFALALARTHGAQAFASIIPRNAARPSQAPALRKDYAFLFERFFYFLNGLQGDPMGYLVFDELDKSQSHILLGQVSSYFLKTHNGRTRSRLIIPEPFFVHSDLTSLVQLADLVAYIISWGMRLNGMQETSRPELAPLASDVISLRFTRRTESGHAQWGFKVINDLRPLDK